MVFSVVNTKGGVGKTTIAVHLAACLAQQGTTLLIDGDPQASAVSWAAWRRERNGAEPSPTTTSLTGRAIYEEGRDLASKYAHAVIDVGGRDSAGLRASLMLSDRAIVPVGASQLDAAAMTDVLLILDTARDYNPTLAVRVLLNRIDPRTRDTADMLAWLKTKPLEVMSAALAERVAYRRSVGEGMTVWEYGKDKAAAAEVEAVLKEVLA